MTTNTRGIIELLKKTYPNAKIILKYKTPWELLVSVVLSAQCTDVLVNKVTEKLFAKYKTFDDYVKADRSEFEKDIKSTGFFRNKAKNILATARLVKDKYGGKVPGTMEELLTLPGVARKTANVILGNAFEVVEGIAVDTHVARVSQRLRLVDLDKIGGKNMLIDFKKDADPVKIERELMGAIPKSDWFKTTYLLIDHGRAICKAQNPKCSACILNKLCPSSRAIA
ncbi:endonuclease III [Candidatus Gottesmanbacteria bacterium RIFCSPLOWO2_01_FULL_43_11b]|uniref:Endonuclease III n=1 Tax=Candidatus Gottesmanbacteria bacterium RIFCSPLOWO2_01_FULL_43_11b TaxID=1798392 RepID=A0A1F6AHG9_9BACT|nr:MAG: endonuclease III [Candidatus Gottesmanbacteria bacterium RIFCSPLOWO2_01_FULL_43_11b]